jgi:hypothetical protein
MVYFVVNKYIFPVLVCCTKKNLATLIEDESKPGLPDCLFSNKKIQIWASFGGPCN